MPSNENQLSGIHLFFSVRVIILYFQILKHFFSEFPENILVQEQESTEASVLCSVTTSKFLLADNSHLVLDIDN